MKIDIDTLRQQVITDQLQKVVEVVGGTGKFPVEGGTVVMESYTIITFLPGE